MYIVTLMISENCFACGQLCIELVTEHPLFVGKICDKCTVGSVFLPQSHGHFTVKKE